MVKVSRFQNPKAALEQAKLLAKAGKKGAAEKFLVKAGLAKNPKEAKEMLKLLMGQLSKMGHKGGDLEKSLKSYQKKHGLAQTGTLDKSTLASLKKEGVLETKSPQTKSAETRSAKESRKNTKSALKSAQQKSAFVSKNSSEAVKKSQKLINASPATAAQAFQNSASSENIFRADTFIQAAANHVEVEIPHIQNEANELFQNLKKSGLLMASKLTTKSLREAIQQFQKANNLPQTGKIDAKTEEMMKEQGLFPNESQVDENTSQNKSRTDQEQKGVENQSDASTTELENLYGKGEKEAGVVDQDGNAQSGDEKDDQENKRGQASVGEDEVEEAGFYEILDLSTQVYASLDTIVRDDNRKGAPTYSWDATFYKPGIYGKGQKAEPLWHIAFEKTAPFAEVWDEAQKVLSFKIFEMDKDADPPTKEAFRAALRRARYANEE